MENIEVDLIVDREIEVDRDTVRQRFFKKVPFLGKFSYYIFLLTILLVPIIVLPTSWGFQLEFAKKLIFSSGILLSFTLWLITKLENGKFRFPGGVVFWSGVSVLMTYLISSLLSTSIKLSLFGLGYENDTFIAIVILFLAMFLASTFFESTKKLSKYFGGLVVSLFVIGVLELAQIFFAGSVLSGNSLSNFVGKFNDLGILFGLSTLITLLVLELVPPQESGKRRSLQILLAISLIIVAVVNYDLIWAVVGVFSLIVLIYALAYRQSFQVIDSDEMDGDAELGSGFFRNVISRPSFAVLVLCVIFFFTSNGVGSILGKYGIFQLEVRPSWQSTIEVARKSMQNDPIFGSGPNTFSASWAALKPAAVNNTPFWNSDFSVGFGRIPSVAVTMGWAGVLSFGIFLFSLLLLGIKSVMRATDDLFDRFVLFMSFITTLYLWSFSVLYVTDTVILMLTFVSSGIFAATLARVGYISNYELSIFDNPRIGFASVLVLVLLIITTISGSYLMGTKFAAIYNFQQGLYSINTIGNFASAESYIKKAISFDEQDIYYRSLSELYVLELRNLLSGQNIPKETLLSNLQSTLTSAAGSARRATELNPNNYMNWLTLARVGQTVVPLKDVVAGSYDLAFNSYSKALALTPENPNIYLSLAQLQVAKGDIAKAKDYIGQALAKKANFTDALFLLSQIEANQGNVASAIKRAEEAALLAPQDVGILFQLGFLKYLNKDYSGAVSALKQATSIQSNYSNAKYFLGLSYSKLGKISDAINEFREIQVLNPDNQEVKSILNNLKAGRGALENVAAPKNEPKEPEKRSKLPVRDSN